MKALILDDDPAIGRLVGRVAAPFGFASDITVDSQNFRRSYESGVPDVIFLDLRLGETDGIEELRYLSRRLYRNPLVLVSGFDERVLGTSEQLASGLGLTVMGALTKPVRVERLKEIFDRVKARGEPCSANRLFEAILHNELFLEYQPIVTRERRAVAGLEALVRWKHPENGRLMPDQFIPLAAQSVEIIDALTDWVVAAAARERERQRWQGFDLRMSVNVPGGTLHSLDFPDRIQAILREVGVMPGQFCVEITETASSEESVRTMDIVCRLRLKGIEVVIDDFGTGYSSLKNLCQIPFSALKIDRSFVAEMTTSSAARAIVKSTIDLAHNMDLKAIADGVETEETANLLASLGVDALQGCLIAPPLPVGRLDNWLGRCSERSNTIMRHLA